MTATPTAALADYLDQKAQAVKDIETRAAAELNGGQAGGQASGQAGGQAAYQALMRQKAELLAALADDARPLVLTLPEPRAEEADERLGLFSMSAHNSLRIGSVFYMSALLYPDDYKEGQPNTLERFAAEVRAWA
ncbi:MAG: hypothetical protein AUJ49_01780 [Desulfovibrionaceae bacterium CG1_02_65_16]|nr:MAG: hypothetical protein AUJ49_01780 [Desulfovibrionaceae bacterium CG1_02_65_16]